MYHTITKQESEGRRIINFLGLSEEWFYQRQVERRGGRTYMRAKKRRV